MEEFSLFLLLGSIVVGFFVGHVIGGSRGRPDEGGCLGGLLGPIGWLIVLFLPREGRRCPFCREVVAPDATVCPHCQRDIPLPAPPASAPAPKPEPTPEPAAPLPSPPKPTPAPTATFKVVVACPDCGSRYRVPKTTVGLGFQCQKCGTAFTAEQDQ